MQQQEFIWMANNIPHDGIIQDEIGNTIIQLRSQIQLTHNYKKKNQMMIIFQEDQSRFLIPSKKRLEDIYRLHLENTQLTDILRNYCEGTLERK